MAYAIIDTNVYIDHWQGDRHAGFFVEVRKSFVIRQSSVVLHELRRGAIKPKAVALVEQLRKICPATWEPTVEDWWQSAVVLAELRKAHGFDKQKLRALQNDVLIALTCRRFGATLITANTSDFASLGRKLGIRIVVPTAV